MSEKYVAYVGTYTRGSGEGIYIYDVNAEEGTMKKRKSVPVSNSAYLCFSADKRFLYSIADDGVAGFRIEKDGDLTFLNRVEIDGMRASHLSVDRSGRFLFTGGYYDGKVTVLGLNSDGSLRGVLDGVYHRGTGSVAERNFRPHVCCVKMTPDQKYLCAVDNGIDQVKMYTVSDEGKLHLAETLRCPRDSGPRRICFSGDGRFFYVVCELANVVEVYSCTNTDKGPVLDKIQEISTTSDNVDKLHDAACGMTITRDGKHLFTSTAGDNSVAMFEVDQETGLLTKKFALPISGEYPRHINLFPDDRHIACLNYESNLITTFAINYDKNLILQKGRPKKIDTPNCILFRETDE